MDVWTKSVFRYSVTTGSVYYGREYEEKKERQKKTKEQVEAFHSIAMKTILKQPETNAQKDPGEKGWDCYYCGKEGHLKQDCPQASKPPRLHVQSAKDHNGGETAPRDVGLPGWALKTIRTEGVRGSPHKLPS